MFWERFYNLCLKHGTKPNPVAEQVGISSGLITKWKHGATPNTEALVKIADYFNVSVDYLLGRTDNPDSHKTEKLIHIPYEATKANILKNVASKKAKEIKRKQKT